MATARTQYEKLLLISCLISFASFFSSYIRIPVLPLFAASLGADTVEIGIINACFLLTAGALSIPFGTMSDRLGRRPLILLGLCTLAGSSFLLWFSTKPWQMMTIYLLFGIGMAAFAPTMMSYVADFTPTTHLGRAYGWYTMAIYGGMTLGPATGGLLGHVVGLRQVFPIAGAITLAVAAATTFSLPFEARPASHQKPTLSPALLRQLASSRGYVAALVATFGSCFGFGVFITFLPLFARSNGIEAGGTGMIFAAQALANAASRLPFGYLSDRISRRSVLVTFGFLMFGVSLAALGYCRHIAPFMLFAALLGTGMGIAYTAIGGLISESVPAHVRGVAMGGYNTCIYFGMMTSSALMGIVIHKVGFAGGFFIAGGASLAMTLLFHFLQRSVPAKSE